MVWAYMGVSLGERCSIADLFCNVPRNLAILDPDVFKIGCLYFEIGFVSCVRAVWLPGENAPQMRRAPLSLFPFAARAFRFSLVGLQ